MPRNRMIKPDFWADEKIGSLQPNTKLLYIGMWNFCDDIGVTRSNVAFLRANIFPYDDKVNMKIMRSCCNELLNLGLILEHSINKESFYYVKNFNKHQKIDRPSSFRFIPDTTKHNVLELFSSSSTATTLATHSTSNVNVNVNVKDNGEKKTPPKKVTSSHSKDLLDLFNDCEIITWLKKGANKKSQDILILKYKKTFLLSEVEKAYCWKIENKESRKAGLFLTGWCENSFDKNKYNDEFNPAILAVRAAEQKLLDM